MNINYKTAFFISLGVLVFSWILFAGYLIFTLIAFVDAGKSNMITQKECADGDYCADNPVNMPKGGWTNNSTPSSPTNDGMIEPKVNNGKVDASTLHQNIEYRVRYDLKSGEYGVDCTSGAGLIMFITKTKFDNPEMACATDGPRSYIGAHIGKLDKERTEKELANYYDYKTEKMEISGIEGTRYFGKALSMDGENYGPQEIDYVQLENNGIVYTITSDFYDRNVYIW